MLMQTINVNEIIPLQTISPGINTGAGNRSPLTGLGEP